MMKICKECGYPKDRSEFHKQAGSADGLQAKCKVCRRAASAVYRSTRKAEIQQRNAAYYYANREKISERDKRRNALPHRRAAHALASRRYREANRLELQAQKMGHKELLDGALVKLKVCATRRTHRSVPQRIYSPVHCSYDLHFSLYRISPCSAARDRLSRCKGTRHCLYRLLRRVCGRTFVLPPRGVRRS